MGTCLALRVGCATAASALVLAAAPAALAAQTSSSPPVDCAPVLTAPSLDAAFTAAARTADVPADVLKAIGYMQSRWEGHDGSVSSDGGYGMFALKATAPADASGKDGGQAPPSQLARASALTGLPAAQIKTNDLANVCAAAALLASYAPKATTTTGAEDMTPAIARFGSAETFARQVLATLKSGKARTTTSGQSVRLAPQPDISTKAVEPAASEAGADCPADLGCLWVPAPYEKLDPNDPDSTGNYGNHDKADRTGKGGPKLKYIVIHDTEGWWDTTLGLVTDPSYLAWNYTVRSSDGQIANHLDPKDVGWHAGNWYVNAHSIGIEHEGFAGSAGWFTESMYQTSAKLVRYLAHKYDIPLDRAHIIGHDQVPGTVLGATKSVHWDPGPYWDWDHYLALAGAPVGGSAKTTTKVKPGDVVEVRTGYADNAHPVTGCAQASPPSPDCVAGAGTNFVEARQAPADDAPLAKDPGWKPNGADGTTYASDISARIQSGHKLVVAHTSGEWLGVWWAGSLVWVKNPATRPVVLKTTAKTATVAPGGTAAPIYGRAYPEEAAYAGKAIDYQAINALEYTIGAGQTYAVSDDDVETDYYYATSFDGSVPDDRTDVTGQTRYLQLWYAHRQVFVQADDVTVHDARRQVVIPTGLPTFTGKPKVGQTLTVSAGSWSKEVTGFGYHWLVGGRPVKADGFQYVVQPGDVGKRIIAVVTVRDRTTYPSVAATLPTAKVTR